MRVGSTVNPADSEHDRSPPSQSFPFVVEWKSSVGDINVAEIQACLGALAAATSIRKFQEGPGIKLDEKFGVGEVDTDSLCFATTFGPTGACIYAGIYVRTNKGWSFRLQKLKAYSLDGDGTDIRLLRTHFRNILERIGDVRCL